jgi:ornithine carbamoyltransferase
MTMREFTHKHLSDMALVFLGDVRNNVARSLALGAMKLGMDLRLCGPRELLAGAKVRYGAA